MGRRKNPENVTAEEEIRTVLAWAERAGFNNIAAALRSALSKMPNAADLVRLDRRRS